MKELDLSKSVYELTNQYPELIDIMVDLGLTEVAKPAMRASVGKLMTIPRGAKMKGLNMIDVVTTLMANGFKLTGKMPLAAMGRKKAAAEPETEVSTDEKNGDAAPNRTEQIKAYLRRLGEGEDLEAVRAEFAAEFVEVGASEIMNAEQELMREGTPLEEVQRLCDVHSALFHGSTCSEGNGSVLANAEAAVQRMMAARAADTASGAATASDAAEEAAPAAEADAAAPVAPAEQPGHPLNTFARENNALVQLIAQARAALDAADADSALAGDVDPGEAAHPVLARVREVAIHYAKKGDLLYPLLKTRYGIDGPSQVMWTVDDEIRDELSALCRAAELDVAWVMRASKVLDRAEEMIYKEENILFPICEKNFSAEEWLQIYRDGKDYAACLGVTPAIWEAGERELEAMVATAPAMAGGEVVMPGGHLTIPQLTAMLNTLPLEISFVDADDINRFFNEGPKVFKRPMAAIDREVFSCHPPKIEPMVRAILQDFREGTRDIVPVWMEKNGRPMYVQYMAVRDERGAYLGTVEVVQDMEFARKYFSK